MKEFSLEHLIPYDIQFYNKQSSKSYTSAKVIIDVLRRYYLPNSVADIGCGIGTWLKAWAETGVTSFVGYDINEDEEKELYVPRPHIKHADLSQNFYDGSRVDLAYSLEVAEHLPPESSERFIQNIVQFSDCILFSAALPGQAGANHINTHPLQYWVELFKKYGYSCYDFIRPLILNNDAVAPWYKQNVLVFAKGKAADIFLKAGLNLTEKPYMFYDSFFVEKILAKMKQPEGKEVREERELKAEKNSEYYFITGGAGFIGFHLCKRLCESGASVVTIDNLNDYYDVSLKKARLEILKQFKAFTFVEGDIADNKIVQAIFKKYRPNTVVNLAAQAGVRYSIENPGAYIHSNIIGFYNILEACRQNGVKHLVFASSSSVYGGNKKVPFSTEDKVDRPVSLYAATKGSNELMAYCYSHLYKIPATGLRFFTVYGPFGRPDMAYFKFSKNIVNNKTIQIYNNGDMYRDFTYIDDIIDGIMKIMPHIPQENDAGSRYKVYNIGNHTPVSLLDFVSVLEEKLGIKAEKEFLPMQAGDVYTTYADVSDLINDFGYNPSTPIEKGLEHFVDWFKQYYSI